MKKSMIISIIILVLVICFIGGENYYFFKHAEKTIAYISKIETRRDSLSHKKSSHRSTHHDVYVTYEVNGTVYEDIHFDKYSSDMKYGDKVTIYYDPKNPKYIKSKTNTFSLIIFWGGIGSALIYFLHKEISNLIRKCHS